VRRLPIIATGIALLFLMAVQVSAHPMQGWAPLSGPSTRCAIFDDWSEVPVPSGTAQAQGGSIRGITSVAVREGDAPWLYLAGYQGAFRSQGCEPTWVSILDEQPLRPLRIGGGLAMIAVGGTSRVYLGSGNEDPILVSGDNGATWTSGTSRSNGPRAQLPAHSMTIAAAPFSDTVAYARLSSGTMHGHEGLARTADGGLTWDVVGRAPGRLLLVDAHNPDVVSTVGDSCGWCQSIDGGASFMDVVPNVSWPASPTAVASQRDGGKTWLALDDLTLRVSLDAGRTWTLTAPPPDMGNVRSIAAESGDDGRLLVVTTSGRMWVRRAGAP
jgi:hypothetical protein